MKIKLRHHAGYLLFCCCTLAVKTVCAEEILLEKGASLAATPQPHIGSHDTAFFQSFYAEHISGKKGEAKLLKNPHFIDAIFTGEAKANNNSQALSVLRTARKIIVTDKEIIRGSCWDWPHTVYVRAGFPIKERQQLFKGAYGKPPYAPMSMFQSGDWLHFVNLSYHNSAHSAIFVDWLDKDNNMALLASYGGENRNHPARYRAYDVSKVYGVIRPIKQTNKK